MGVTMEKNIFFCGHTIISRALNPFFFPLDTHYLIHLKVFNSLHW